MTNVARGPLASPLPNALTQALTNTLTIALAITLAGCATRAPTPADRDGPDARPPPAAELERLPDALPRIEPIRISGPNKPYAVLGQAYTPQATDLVWREAGLASWYGRKFHGRPTASGEIYDMYAMTAAHKTLPIPSYARVRNPANGREVVVRINDRGPFVPGRIVDLSYTAAIKLGLLGGVAPVEVQRLTFDEIRSGRWRSDAPRASAALPAAGDPARSATALPPDDPAAPGDPLMALVDGNALWLQLGAFRSRDAALQLQLRVQRELQDSGGAAPTSIAVVDDGPLFRVQAGPYPSRELARQASERWRARYGLTPLLIERR